MPDDKIDDTIAEQLTDVDDDEALKSFLEEDESTDGDPPEGDSKPDEKDDPDKKPDGDAPDGKKPDEKGEGYSDELTERLKQPPQEPDKPPEEKPPAEDKKPDAKEQQPPEDPDFEIDMLDDFDFPDEEVKIGDSSVNLKEYKSDYPEDFAAIIAVSSAITKKNIQHLIDTGQLVKTRDLDNIQGTVSDMAFWSQIRETHSDAVQINKSEEFITWLNKQDEPLQRLARNMDTPEDGILIIDYYKKSIAKTKAQTYDKEQKPEKDHHKNLHKGTMRSKHPSQQANDANMDDAEAAFNEQDDDED